LEDVKIGKVLRANSSVPEKDLDDLENSTDAIALRMKHERIILGGLMFDAWNMSRGQNVLFGLSIEDRGLLIGKDGNHYVTVMEVKIYKGC